MEIVFMYLILHIFFFLQIYGPNNVVTSMSFFQKENVLFATIHYTKVKNRRDQKSVTYTTL